MLTAGDLREMSRRRRASAGVKGYVTLSLPKREWLSIAREVNNLQPGLPASEEHLEKLARGWGRLQVCDFILVPERVP